MVMKCNKIRFHTCEGESFVLTNPHIRSFSSLMLLLRAGRKARGDFEEVGTSNTSHDRDHVAVTCCADSADVCRFVSALAQVLGISGQPFIYYWTVFRQIQTGLSLRLGLQRSQAKPKPISSLHQGRALVGLERARLSRLKASSPVQHITTCTSSVERQLNTNYLYISFYGNLVFLMKINFHAGSTSELKFVACGYNQAPCISLLSTAIESRVLSPSTGTRGTRDTGSVIRDLAPSQSIWHLWGSYQLF